MSVAFSRAVAIDATPMYIGDYETFAFFFVSGGDTCVVEVSPVTVPGAGDWYTLGTLTTGKIMTDPTGLPTGQLAAWRAVWVRATAISGSLTITGSLK